jgi:hypothetical protein
MCPQVFQPPLLLAKVGHGLLIGRRGEQHEVVGGVAKIIAEAYHERREEECVGDRKLQVA